MLKDTSRLRVIQIWFAAIVVVVTTGVAFGLEMGAGTAALLFGASLVPPAIVVLLWPKVQAETVAEILHDRRV